MTTVEVAIHPKGENPIFGEGSTRIRLVDEGAGSFIVVSQSTEEYGDNEIRLDFEEVEHFLKAIKILEDGRTY